MARETIKTKMMNKNTNLTKKNGKKKMAHGKKAMNMALGDNKKQKERNELEEECQLGKRRQ
jgi:hypothetical protein